MSRPAIPGATAREVAVRGVRFRVFSAAPARKRRTTPVLLLHGVPQTATMWRGLLPELARDRAVIAPDLKGMGESEARGPYDIPTLVAELAALVLHEVDGPVDVIGHDWGGALGLALAADRPELVRRLIDVSGPYRKVDPLRTLYIPALALPVLPEVAFRLAGPDIARTAIRAVWRAPEPMPAELLDHYAGQFASPATSGAVISYYRSVVKTRAAAGLGALVGGSLLSGTRRDATPPAPLDVDRTLVVWGGADPVTPVSDGEAVVRDVGGSVEMLVVPGVGHFPVEEAPGVVVPAIAEFLRAG
jgi:pimeloyl-ACP methyl ester carboxylesterase